MGRRAVIVLYVLALAAVVVGVDVLFVAGSLEQQVEAGGWFLIDSRS